MRKTGYFERWKNLDEIRYSFLFLGWFAFILLIIVFLIVIGIGG